MKEVVDKLKSELAQFIYPKQFDTIRETLQGRDNMEMWRWNKRSYGKARFQKSILALKSLSDF